MTTDVELNEITRFAYGINKNVEALTDFLERVLMA
jgi:hypothetical protein